jgi:hypothetical protein
VPVNCDDGNPCSTDTCNILDGTCTSTTPNYDLNSPVGSTSDLANPRDICLTAGSQARYVIYVNLRDLGLNPLPGETVSIEARSGVAVWADAVTESAILPGTYYRTLVAPPGAGSAEIEITLCAGAVVMNLTVLVTYAPANTNDRGGTGGCNPAAGFLVDGNLKITVVEEETGNTISGARVMIGSAENATLYETSFEAWLGDAAASVPVDNICVTDGAGVCEFYDYGANLYDVQVTTAGDDGRAYFTIVGSNASDLVLPLTELHPVTDKVRWTNEETDAPDRSGFGILSWVNAGMALPKLDLSFFSRCEITALMEPYRCVNANGSWTPVPENFFLPRHSLFGERIARTLWNITLDSYEYDPQSISFPYGRLPTGSVSEGWISMLRQFQYQEVGFLLDHPVVPDDGGKIVLLNDNYPSTLNVSVDAAIPFEADLFGVSGGDYDGLMGSGELFMMSHGIYHWTQAGPPRNFTLPVSDLDAAGSPNGVTMLAGVAARFMEDDPGRSVVPPANLRWANTATVFRDDGLGNPPFGPAGGNWTASDLLDFAGVYFTEPGVFEWEDSSANAIQPDYSLHYLNLDELTYPPPPCEANDPTQTTRLYIRSKSVQWVVARSFAATCAGGVECFQLPVLPAGWPRQGAGVHKRDGFEQREGSGATCAIDANCNAGLGEVCRDVDQGCPDGLRCTKVNGSDFVVQTYYWWAKIYRLGLLGSFDFDSFAFDSNVDFRTEQSSNELDFSN